jgi:hypothetical protein
MPEDLRITTAMLFQGALLFALIDAAYVPLLAWQVKREYFERLQWPLAICAAIAWFGIWSWATGNFRETVYAYIFPEWALNWIPWMAGAGAAVMAWLLQRLALRSRSWAIPAFCLGGGCTGAITHIWAVYRGIVSKPPMLQGASPYGAVMIAFFEFTFYWCTILLVAAGAKQAWHYAGRLYYRASHNENPITP